jgi:hypothetical protein
MRTPYGKECKYFYGNYYRGQTQEECRLVEGTPEAEKWNASLCRSCPVPDILRANACPTMLLRAEIKPRYLVFGNEMRISAYCTKTSQVVNEPEIGCGECHPLPAIFYETSDE